MGPPGRVLRAVLALALIAGLAAATPRPGLDARPRSVPYPIHAMGTYVNVTLVGWPGRVAALSVATSPLE